MTIKVIGAGLGRTGTASLKKALEMIGFGPCYHMSEVFGNPEHLPLWQSVIDGSLSSLEPLLAGYHATCDWPTCSYYEVQMQMYPDAKVLLTVRDPEKWYESTLATIYPLASHLEDAADPVRMAHSRFAKQLIWEGHFKGRFEDKAYAIDVFNQHNEAVKRIVPAEKLLVFDVHEGWGPLCSFLDVAVPAEAFPRVNDRESFLERRRGAATKNLT